METKIENIFSGKQVFHIVSQDLKTYDFEVLDHEVKQLGEIAGFLGEHRKLEVNIRLLANDNAEKKLIYFVKKTPNSALQKEFFERHGTFFKEIGMYKVVFSEFNKVLPENKIKWRADYYYSKDSDLFVVEDLIKSGYYMLPERTLLDKDHILVSLRSIAAMHASSMILEEKLKQGSVKIDSRTPNELNVTVWELFKDFLFEAEAPTDVNHPGHISREVGIRAAHQLVDYLPFSEKEKSIIKEKLPNAMRRIYKLVIPSKKYKNVICHGDLWANNILFKKNNSGKVQEAVLVDFQLARYAPPAQDVVDFIHLVQSKKFREKHQEEFFVYYYNQLTSILEKSGLDIKKLLSWHEFRSSCDYYEELGCIMPLFFFQPILTPKEISDKFLTNSELYHKFWQVDRNEMVLECFLNDNIYRERYGEALNEFIKKFVLN